MPGAQKKLSPDSGSSEEGEFQCVRRGFQGGHEAPTGFIKRVDLESRGMHGSGLRTRVGGSPDAGAQAQRRPGSRSTGAWRMGSGLSAQPEGRRPPNGNSASTGVRSCPGSDRSHPSPAQTLGWVFFQGL